VNIRNRWRTCGNNALYPQGGTWVYDRGNWCPGNVVFPDVVMNSVTGNSAHSYDIDMQNYVGTGSLGNEVINAHLFQYAAPNNANDASIEEMTKPSKMYEYTRFNPICANPEILIRNNGSNTLTTADIKYGFAGALQTYTYTGNLAFGDTATVKLPNLSWTNTSGGNFIACISTVNSQPDQYTYDDTAKAIVSLPPVNDSIFMVVFYTNNNPWENSYTISDAAGNIVHSRIGTSLAANTMYRDTIHFIPGCYSLKVYDTGGDGLSFWANSAQGSGQIKLKKMYTSATNYFKIFNGDFGNFIYYDFIVNPNVTSVSENANEKPYFIVYPNPASDQVTIVFDAQWNDAGSLKILNVLGEILYEKNIRDLEDNRLTIDVQAFERGVYFVRLVKNNKVYTRKIILSR
jgi:hypothetical protein